MTDTTRKASPQNNNGSAKQEPQVFNDWQSLNAEATRRIETHKTFWKTSSTMGKMQGLCHKGQIESPEIDPGIELNLTKRTFRCLRRRTLKCSQGAILEALGLPDQPNREGARDNAAEASSGLPVKRLSEVELESVTWLWEPYIALGKLTLIVGDPGIGKSWLTLAIATAISNGTPLRGMKPTEPRNVLIFSAEDGAADTIKPRLQAMGADVSRIYVVEMPVTLDEIGLLKIEAAIIEHQPTLVIIDPLTAYLGAKVDMHRANETREPMAKLTQLAAQHGCAIVPVAHMSKSEAAKVIYRALGSIDLIAAVRSALLVARDKDNQCVRWIVHIKSNLAKEGPSLNFELQDGSFTWLSESDVTAEELLGVEKPRGKARLPSSALLEAQEFLREMLSNGPCLVEEVMKEASNAGISGATLRRAKEELHITSKKTGGQFGGNPKWHWMLPDDNWPPTDEPTDKTTDPSKNNERESAAQAEGAQDPATDTVCPLKDLGDEHLQQEAAHNEPGINKLTEDAQDERLQGEDEHLQAKGESSEALKMLTEDAHQGGNERLQANDGRQGTCQDESAEDAQGSAFEKLQYQDAHLQAKEPAEDQPIERPAPNFVRLIPTLHSLRRFPDAVGQTVITAAEAASIRACGFEAQAGRWRCPKLPADLVREDWMLGPLAMR